MDYTKIPRELIYRDRKTLNDFGVNDSMSFNHLLYSHLKRQRFLLDENNAKELVLQCFNNAYYICTLIYLDDYPDLCIAHYASKASEGDFKDELLRGCVCAASLAMACELLSASDNRWKEDKTLIDAFRERISAYGSSSAFINVEQEAKRKGIQLTRNMYTPRNIQEIVNTVSEKEIALNSDYICERICQQQYSKKTELANMLIDRLDQCLEWVQRGIINAEIRDITIIRTGIEAFEKLLQQPEEEQTQPKDEPLPLQSTKTDIFLLQARINELQKNVELLTNQLEEAKKENKEKEDLIVNYEERIADYEARFDPKDVKSKKVIAMTDKQHVILFLAVLAKNNSLPNARTNLSVVLSFIASRSENTMIDYLKEAITTDECKKLAQYFDSGENLSSDCPFIAKIIQELPEKLEKDKSEKNRTKALNKVNK